MFVLADIFICFFYYVGNFSYYAGIMLYTFQPLLCLKLCWYNQLKPSHTTGLIPIIGDPDKAIHILDKTGPVE